MRTLKQWFKNLAFQRKVVIIAVLSSIIPIFILSVLSFSYINSLVIDRELVEQKELSQTMENQLSDKIQSLHMSMSFLANNDLLSWGLTERNHTNYSLYDYYTNTIVPLFNSVNDVHDEVRTITLYTTKEINNHGEYVKHLNEAALEELLPTENSSIYDNYRYDTQNIYYYSTIHTRGSDDKHILVFEIDKQQLFKDLQNTLINNASVTITSSQNEIVYSLPSTTPAIAEHSVLLSISRFIFDGFISQNTVMENGWTLNIAVEKAIIYQWSVLVFLVVLIVYLFVILTIHLLITILSRTTVKPIQNLVKQMRFIPVASLELGDTYESKDEIGVLYSSFERMIQQIKQLINDVYKGEITQKKIELRALQAQINPHFFYNSLALINNKAILSGNDDIVEMSQLLSKYYRLSLNQGKNIITIFKEIELTSTYVLIQQKMHNYSFDYDTEIAKEVLHYEFINLIIQPFIENAILHGLDYVEDSRQKYVKLITTTHNGQLIFRIKDNGVGMSSETITQVTSQSSENYGISNVIMRLKLYFGIENPVMITSEINKGTEITIIIPLEKLAIIEEDTFLAREDQ